MDPNKLISNFSRRKAAEFRRRFAMARPYPVCGHAVARRAKVVCGGSGRIPLPQPAFSTILTQVNATAWLRLRICDQCRLIASYQTIGQRMVNSRNRNLDAPDPSLLV